MIDIFFSYSHADEEYRNRLEVHLAPMKRDGLISGWHDRRIMAGARLHDEISEHLEEAGVILLLVSADFLASDYCHKIEMARALERHKRKEAVVIPIIVRPCDWKNTLLGDLRATPKDGVPITKHPNHDDAYLEIVTDIRNAISTLDSHPQHKKMKPSPSVQDVVTQRSPRSSNLRIRKEFTDHEKDTFLDDTFEYISNFFDNSLNELKSRNQEIDIRFRRNGSKFVAAVYQRGEKQCSCKVWRSDQSRFIDGIAYSSDETGSGYNEILTVEADELSLSLNPSMSYQQNKHLSQQGASEHLWSKFIDPLQ